MYITVIDKRNTSTKYNIVDALFDDVPMEEVTSIIRTKTYKRETCNVDTVPLGAMLVFCRHIQDIIEKHPDVESEYEQFKIPKKTHGFRTINAPKPELKKDMKDIANALTEYLKIKTHDSAWAYTKSRDVVGAVQEHTKNKSKWFLKLDLHDFFGSCNPEFITERLLDVYPFAAYKDNEIVVETVKALAKFATLDNGLPQGTPLSPVLTNIIMIPFDYNMNKKMYALANGHKIPKQPYVYTRYADDILISAYYDFDFNEVVNGVKDLLEGTPLQLNVEKTRYGSSAGRNWNLGVMCNKDNKITIGYKRKQKLKATIHNYINTRGTWELEDLRWLLGNLSWLRNVEPDYFIGLMNYCENKYNTDIWNTLIKDITRYSN